VPKTRLLTNDFICCGFPKSLPLFDLMYNRDRAHVKLRTVLGGIPAQQNLLSQPSWAFSSTPPVQTSFPSQMKSSKSYGDILSEMKRESSATANPFINDIKAAQRKLSSQTPPPRPANVFHSEARANMLDDWIPWPDLVYLDFFRKVFAV